MENRALDKVSGVIIGNRIPKDFFITFGSGESDITVHAGSYHLALRDAGIEKYNIMTYSSILPSISNIIEKPIEYEHGAVMESIMAVSTCKKGDEATAGITFAWLLDKTTKKRCGGLVCECNDKITEYETEKQLNESLKELFYNGFAEKYKLVDQTTIIRSITPKKKYGTVLVSLCFVNYVVQILGHINE